MLKYLDYETFKANAASNLEIWKSYEGRWRYHARAIEVIQGLGLSRPKQVLELGTLGASLVLGSDTMDYANEQWVMPGYRPTIVHDARDIPWPVKRRYELFIALRIWHHLAPVQEEAFREARRIAENVLIVCPEKEVVGVGIPREKFTEWNDGKPATIEENINGGWGRLYFWGAE